MAVKAARIRPGPRDPLQHAHRIADLVTDTWYGRHGSGRLEVPVSVVAALSLLSPPFNERREFAAELVNLDPDAFAQYIRHLWHCYIQMRPDLVNRVWPLIEPWESDTNAGVTAEAVRAAKAVGEQALLADQFSLTGTDNRFDVDLLGVLLSTMRPKASLQARGQYYTPASVSDLMAKMLDIEEGASIHEPCVATGGNFRAAAKAMLEAGRDPATCSWSGVDLDYLAVACCAVNVHVWGLGYNVLLGVGDALLNDWWERAARERAETIGIARDLRMLALLRVLTGDVKELLAASDDGDQADDSAEPDVVELAEHHDDAGQAADPVDAVVPDPEAAPEPAVEVGKAPAFWDLVNAVTEDQP